MKYTYTKELYKMAREATATNGSCAMSTSTLSALLDEIDRLQQASRWIPTSEKYPEYNKRVVIRGNGVVCGEEMATFWGDHWTADYSDMLDINDVSDWFILPTPPEGE